MEEPSSLHRSDHSAGLDLEMDLAHAAPNALAFAGPVASYLSIRLSHYTIDHLGTCLAVAVPRSAYL